MIVVQEPQAGTSINLSITIHSRIFVCCCDVSEYALSILLSLYLLLLLKECEDAFIISYLSFICCLPAIYTKNQILIILPFLWCRVLRDSYVKVIIKFCEL